MNIIFVTIAYPRTSSESNLYTDLMEEFAEHGHKVYVVCSIEKRFGKVTHLTETNGIQVLRVSTGDITSNPNYIAKGLALLQLQSQFIRAIKDNFPGVAFDLILYATPPIQYNRIIRFLKIKSKAVTYLLLKDIFPQNALDMGLFSKWNLAYWYFKRQEKKTYALSDYIGCMSPANVSYLLAHNSSISPSKVGVCANSLKDRGILNKAAQIAIRTKIRNQFAIGEDELLLIYGGNLGIAQGLSFLVEILKAYANNLQVRFLIVGEGTWFSRIEKSIQEVNANNVLLYPRVSPVEFKELLIASDIGLIFLNPRFTIPNFPSRLTSCLEIGLPVIACTDAVSDVGDIVAKAGCGYKVISGDLNGFAAVVSSIINSPDILSVQSTKARELFVKAYTTAKSYADIMKQEK